jgi:adenosylhomocysteine nucleosidase
VLFPLQREMTAFLRQFPAQERFVDAPCWASFCGPSWLNVLAVRTGMGHAATEYVLAWLEQRPLYGGVPYRPKLILSTGFAGGLSPELHTGALVLATEVCDLEGNCWPCPWPGVLTGNWQPPLVRGRLLTAAKPVATGEEKLALASKHGALAVDMESALVARWCRRQGVPFGALRVIADDASTTLSPAMLKLLEAGVPSRTSAAAAVLRRPWLLRELLRLARQTSLAGEELGKALGELLTLTLPFGAEL